MTDVVPTTSPGGDHPLPPESFVTSVVDRHDAALADLKRRTVELAHRTHASIPGLRELLSHYYRHVVAEDLLTRTPEDILGPVVSHLREAEDRPQGTSVVHVFTPSDSEHGWSTGHTVVEIVTDDMPFLVDSVSMELARQGLPIHLVIHPQLVVRRDVVGRLLEVLDLDPGDRESFPPDAIVESWMHFEIDRQPDPEVRARTEENLQRVLRDVRESVEDWPRMRQEAAALIDQLEANPPRGVDQQEVAESLEFLRWLVSDNFTFLGLREYDLVGEPGEEALRAVPGTGLGLLRADQQQSTAFAKLPPEVRAKAREKHVLVLTKANTRSTVHRSAYLDYVGVKRFDEDGNVTGERRFLGLYTASAYTRSVLRIPILRERVQEVIARSGFVPGSHSDKDLLQLLETFPRDELFQVSANELLTIALAVLHLKERRRTRLFMRRDPYGRFWSCLVYLPRDRYTTTVRLRIEQILREELGGVTVDYTAHVSESVLARLHYVVRVAPGTVLPTEVDVTELEQRLVAATRSWRDDFSDALQDQVGEAESARLMLRYADGFPEAYKEDFPARTGVADVLRLDAMGPDDTALNLYQTYATDPLERRLKVYRTGAPVSLSRVLPVLQQMGVEVVDERPYEIDRTDDSPVWVYDFGLRFREAITQNPLTLKERFEDTFRAAWDERTEPDGYNALVLNAGLTWRQAMVLRAYARYLRQAGSPFGQDYVESVVIANVAIARLLVQLFEVKFDPDAPGDRDQQTQFVVGEIEAALDAVESLDADRILRSFLALMVATLRTNYFQVDHEGNAKASLAVKLDPLRIPDLPLPRPRFEIWVYSPRVEGVHLRFGQVARGGLRWSDRREDFRTEILGLVKAQAVKNSVIVPVGAKGGFYPKRLPDPQVDREAWLAEGVASYTLFISSLLDLTDNLVSGEIVPPPRVVRHDDDDPYLVVAADKGTATFSDIANGVALSYGFWLGDAFASGGSAGYDHKAMGITARGAWESVKRHFRELGVDTQTQDFTAVGIGDMSGDVFGNGMLLSEHIRLVAAFDHRHIFVDPDPVAASSFVERRRLFDLPRSSWADYDTSLISEGGGVFPRSLKSVPISAQMAAALGIPAGVERMTPAELMKAILCAPVDLLWNGGIGTYVKSGVETNADVGDKSNDAIRIDGSDLRCKVVGEGGNLGLTQLGRIEAAEAGVRLNTDAIDNSAGVDTSDHEVNLKILLDQVVRDGDLTEKQRNVLLAEMTDEVADLVLADNYDQNVVLGNARTQASAMLPVHQRMIQDLERRGILDRELEFLPSDDVIADRAGRGLTSPELSVLLAYSKMALEEDLHSSSLPDDAWFARTLREYMPVEVVSRYGDRLDAHPLRRDIINTVVGNDVVNHGGITYIYRATEETGASADEVVRAYTVAREVFDLPDFWRRINALDNVVPTAAQSALYLESRRLLDRSTRWFLTSRGGSIDVGSEIERFHDTVARLAPAVPGVLLGAEQERLQRRAADYESLGAPRELSVEAAALLDVFSLLDITEVATRTGAPADEVLSLYFAVSERYEVDRTLTRITGLPRDDRWAALARQALRSDLYAAIAGLTSRVIRATPEGGDPVDRVMAWEQSHAEGLSRARATLDDISRQEQVDLATLSVALRTMRTLVTQGGTPAAQAANG
ncbi:MAG: NAD-glutamate dehydrogenase [Candidatus Nanopelagicales bacterium]